MSEIKQPKTGLDWSEIAFKDKSNIKKLKPIFILAPRDISKTRFVDLVKEFLPKGNLIVGLAKEDFVYGFEGQPQFAMLKEAKVKDIVNKIASSGSKNKVYLLHYYQREASYIVDKLKPKLVLLINGSWKYVFHISELFYQLVSNKIPFEYLSPFNTEVEARSYEKKVSKIIASNSLAPLSNVSKKSGFDTASMMSLAKAVAEQSFDYNFQTGAVLGIQSSQSKYGYLDSAFNRIVPYQTYALHHGASREKNFSPSNDLNHYDTVHAEIEIIISAQKNRINLKNATLFVNLMPCPPCSRALCETDIAEIVYELDHSDGYAISMLEKAGKKVRRYISQL